MAVALRTLAAHDGGRLVVSGHAGEAARLAALAPAGVDISIESTARSTLENVERPLPPNLVTRLIRPEYGWRDGWWMDAGGAVYESLRRIRRVAKQLRNHDSGG